MNWVSQHTKDQRKETGMSWLSFDVENFILDPADLEKYRDGQMKYLGGDLDVPDVRIKRLRTNENPSCQVPALWGLDVHT